MARTSPQLAPGGNHHAHWGVYSDFNNLPNSNSNPYSGQPALEAGDTASAPNFVSAFLPAFTSTLWECVNPGTPGGADATWRPSGGAVGIETSFGTLQSLNWQNQCQFIDVSSGPVDLAPAFQTNANVVIRVKKVSAIAGTITFYPEPTWQMNNAGPGVPVILPGSNGVGFPSWTIIADCSGNQYWTF